MILHYEVSGIVKLTEAEGRTVVARGWGRENSELLFKGYKVSVIRDE